MIAFINGEIADFTQDSVIIEAGGIGYEVFMTSRDLKQLVVGKKTKIHTYFSVREDAMLLYGFLSKDDLNVFRMLIGVSGIGPKGGIGILSGITSDELRFAILSDDVKTLSKAPGIGKKTAQKVILELKDKLNLQDAFEQKMDYQIELSKEAIPDAKDHTSVKEAIEALIALGYNNTDAYKAVNKVDGAGEMDVESILKAALKNIYR